MFVGIPDALLQDCPGVEWAGGSYRQLAELALAREAALRDCNDQLREARAYQRNALSTD